MYSTETQENLNVFLNNVTTVLDENGKKADETTLAFEFEDGTIAFLKIIVYDGIARLGGDYEYLQSRSEFSTHFVNILFGNVIQAPVFGSN
ncbi:MAG: hypothetical protein LBH03_03675 [Holophagales bacterium]|nr:hypothetical protein [Holophagales bacterium]